MEIRQMDGQGVERRITIQQQLYQAYARAAEAYVKKPTLCNWEKKEEAFEIYTHTILSYQEHAA